MGMTVLPFLEIALIQFGSMQKIKIALKAQEVLIPSKAQV